MTRNQILYWDLKEKERSNRVNEKETHRANVARETETNRHNVVVEVETERHNRATELLTASQVAEANRHNLVAEAQNASALQEQQRSNMAREDIQRQNVQLGYANVQLGYSQLGETARHNRESERAYLINLDQDKAFKSSQIDIQSQQVDETIRSNKERERQNQLSWLTSVGAYGETARHNQAVEAETNRSNLVNEKQGAARTAADAVKDTTQSARNVTSMLTDAAHVASSYLR